MTNRERVYASFAHEQPDRTPYQIGFTQKAMAAMVEHHGGDDFLGEIDNCFHAVAPKPGPKDCWLDEDTWQDEFGVQWDRTVDRDIGNPRNCLIPERSLDDLELPDPRAPGKFEGFAQQVATSATTGAANAACSWGRTAGSVF